ncbi:MAG: hypothetical protein ACR2GK_09075 [Gemmatimonadaceae bacterium]
MDLERTSYDFHSQLESPSAFIRREWKTIALCTAAFVVAMLAAVFYVDPAFFYPRLSSDPLNYWLKARALVESGTTEASWAVNLRPFAYVALPGILRAPFLLAFSDFDDQLRGMQVANIAIVASVALMSAYIFSWVLPVARHRMAIAFAFAFTLLSPIWVANVFLPLADAPYAGFTLATLIVSVRLFCSDRPLASRPWLIALVAILFTVSFLLRFTAPVLLLFMAPLALARWKGRTVSTRARWAGALVALMVVVPLIMLNLGTIRGRYFREPFAFLERGDKTGMLINLFGAGFPTQIIPTFQLGFLHPPIVDTYSTSFSNAVPDMAWAAFGILISVVIVAGIWFARRPFLPEILYFLGALPVLALMMPSTTRYLMPYQPLFWIFFYLGAATLAYRRASWVVRLVHSRVAVIGILVAAVGLAVGLRAWKVAGSASESYFAVTVQRVPAYVTEVSGVFRSLRGYLETLPKDRALLIGGRGTVGRWKAISDVDYYAADSALSRVVSEKDVYLLIECGTQEACLAWEIWKERTINRLLTFGEFDFEPVFESRSGRSRAEVLRLRPRD